MSVHLFPSPQDARRRASQRQQQPARFWLNRQQQQQGSTEYQRGQVEDSGSGPVSRSVRDTDAHKPGAQATLHSFNQPRTQP